jgi:hypothetical protein
MGFGATLAQLWTTISTILAAINLFASGAKNLGEWTDESTKTFVDEARIERQKKLAKLNAELAHTQQTAVANAQAAPAAVAPTATPAP